MFFSPLSYEEPLFRPPAEANSLIFQLTVGCSWNKCSFCEMYTMKKFRVRDLDDVKNEIKEASGYFPEIRKFFIADGNAMVLSASKLMDIITCIKENFSKIQRISAYALPRDLMSKSDKELQNLNKAGLKILYIGIETGDDSLLKAVNKRETYSSTLDGINKAHNAGIDTSLMVINGLGGLKYSMQHAENSAKIINLLQPKYLSLLTLILPKGLEHYKSRFKGEFIPLDLKGLLRELKVFVTGTELKNTIFRTDHISNYLVLKGILSRDKHRMMNLIDKALNNCINVPFNYSSNSL
jgi:radical SAM superfamily enzyme YgiQ (UPF0313 family)